MTERRANERVVITRVRTNLFVLVAWILGIADVLTILSIVYFDGPKGGLALLLFGLIGSGIVISKGGPLRERKKFLMPVKTDDQQ